MRCVDHEKNKTGKVIFVGAAPRFNIRAGTAVAQAIIHNNKLLPPKKLMQKTVIGKVTPICPKKVIPSHKK